MRSVDQDLQNSLSYVDLPTSQQYSGGLQCATVDSESSECDRLAALPGLEPLDLSASALNGIADSSLTCTAGSLCSCAFCLGGFTHGTMAYMVPGSGNGMLLRIDLAAWHPSPPVKIS